MTDRVDDWDRDLSASEVLRLTPLTRRERCRISFERKVHFIERLGLTLGPEVSDFRKFYNSPASFRKWNDPSLKLWRWSDAEVDDPKGKNRELRRRYEDAVSHLKSSKKAPKKDAKKIKSDMGRELEIRDLRIAQLERQILDLMGQLRRAQRAALIAPIRAK